MNKQNKYVINDNINFI